MVDGKASTAPQNRTASVLFLAGMSLYWSVITYQPNAKMFASGTTGLEDEAYGTAYLLQNLLVLIVGVVLSRHARAKAPGLLSQRWTLAACDLALVGALAAAYFLGYNPVVDILCAVLGALYIGLLTFRFALVAQGLPQRTVLVSLCLSAAIYMLLVTILHSIALPFDMAKTARSGILLLLSGAVCCFAPAAQNQRPAACDTDVSARREPLLLFVFLAIYLLGTTLCRAVLDMVSGFREPTAGLALSKTAFLILALAFTAAVARRSARQENVRFPWTAFMAICLASVYLTIVFFAYVPLLCRDIILASKLYTSFLTFYLGFAVAEWFRVSYAESVCLFGLACEGAQSVVSCLTANALHSVADGWPQFDIGALFMPTIAATALASTVAAVVYLITAATGRSSAPKSSTGAGTSTKNRPEACNRLAVRHALTDRELETLLLIAEGHSQKQMALTMQISQNTVHSYVQSVYAKMGAHSRQEVINMCDREADRASDEPA